jgi:two-component system sensor histidine kinase KdpD
MGGEKWHTGIVGGHGLEGMHMGSWRRAAVGSVAALIVMAPLVAVMVPLRSHLSIATSGLVLVVPVVAGVVVGGLAAGVFGVFAGFLVYDLVFIPPYFTLSVGRSENWVALGVYVAVMLLVANVVARLERARAEARQHEQAIRRLFELTDLLIEDRPLSEILELIVSTVHDAFALRSVALVLPVGTRLDVVARAGDPLSEAELRRVAPAPGMPASLAMSTSGDPEQAQTVALTATGRPVGLLHVWGSELSPYDQDLLRTFGNQIALALERAQLREQALRTELLEEVDRLQRALVGAVSHDLRTPLATIKASASTLRDVDADVASCDRDELLELIDSQTDRLDRLVTNLLDVSRVQAGALELRNGAIGVVDLVSDALRGLGRLAETIEITIALEDDLPLVDVDHLLIGQVLANLLDNAIRFAPPHTAIAVTARLRDDGLVELAVEDKGPGVPTAEQTNVFVMFNRGGSLGGTGVGLSIAKAFVEAHGQQIWVADSPGGGARFCFTMAPAPVTAAVS